uniref:Uncharacterized protein n=1 Tax=Neogobius melanostomus TaxID=47308 RepID=A0A8C6U127_9GOBI
LTLKTFGIKKELYLYTISGKVSLELIKWNKILRLYVQAKGEAYTTFTEEVSDGEGGTYNQTMRGHGRLRLDSLNATAQVDRPRRIHIKRV